MTGSIPDPRRNGVESWTLRRVLCATDFSDNAAAALDAAVAVAQAAQATLLVLHVARPAAGRSQQERAAPIPAEVARARADPVEELARIGRAATSAGVETERSLRRGDPAEQIVAEAQRAGADLIVVGLHSRDAPDHWFVGSVTECVVRTAPCPVMVVKPSPRVPRDRPRQVVCALDLGATSPATLAHAAALTNRLRADLLVLHVAGGSADATPDAVLGARAGLAALIMGAPTPRGRVRQKVVVGSPREEILGAADAAGADLVVVGSHAGCIRDRQFIGSTTLHLLRHAACDVLIVPAGVAGAEGQDRTRPSDEAETPPPRCLGRAR
jgi:nucleotide-binding universal stress UspA family protein